MFLLVVISFHICFSCVCVLLWHTLRHFLQVCHYPLSKGGCKHISVLSWCLLQCSDFFLLLLAPPSKKGLQLNFPGFMQTIVPRQPRQLPPEPVPQPQDSILAMRGHPTQMLASICFYLQQIVSTNNSLQIILFTM